MKQSARASHAICMATSLDLTKTDPPTFRFLIIQQLDTESLPDLLGVQALAHMYTPNFRKFSRFFSRPSCTSSGSGSSPLRCPWTSPLRSVHQHCHHLLFASTPSSICQRWSAMLSCSSSARSLLGCLPRHPCQRHPRDLAVAVRAGWSMSLLCRSCWILGAVVKETVEDLTAAAVEKSFSPGGPGSSPWWRWDEGDFLRALYTGTGLAVVSTRTRPP